MNGLFVSDLHLSSQRSVGQQHWDELGPHLDRMKMVVLGGDIFDFRWSRVGSFEQSIDEASDWLLRAIDERPQIQWTYLLGNHDCHPNFQERLDELRGRRSQFHWSACHWRHANKIFLHGDVLDSSLTQSGLDRYRRRFHEERSAGRLKNLAYSAAVRSRLHCLMPRLRHRSQLTCRRLLQYLAHCDHQLLDGIDSVYFGHTHVPMRGYRFRGVKFYNGGSGIRFSQFHPVMFDVESAPRAE